MTNQNNEFGKSPVKLSSPTQIWIDDVNQNNELDEILAKAMAHYKAEDWNGRRILTEAKQAIEALYASKPVEKVNETPNSVDLTKPKVNLIDIASPNMTPEASKVVSDAIERSAEVMNKTAKPVENGELRDKAHKTLDVYLDGGGPYEFVIVNKDDYERTIEARLAERAKLKGVK